MKKYINKILVMTVDGEKSFDSSNKSRICGRLGTEGENITCNISCNISYLRGYEIWFS